VKTEFFVGEPVPSLGFSGTISSKAIENTKPEELSVSLTKHHQ
jgi:hypothetical protein